MVSDIYESLVSYGTRIATKIRKSIIVFRQSVVVFQKSIVVFQKLIVVFQKSIIDFRLIIMLLLCFEFPKSSIVSLESIVVGRIDNRFSYMKIDNRRLALSMCVGVSFPLRLVSFPSYREAISDI